MYHNTVYCCPVSWLNAMRLLNWNLHWSAAGAGLMATLLLSLLPADDDDDDGGGGGGGGGGVSCSMMKKLSLFLQRSWNTAMSTWCNASWCGVSPLIALSSCCSASVSMTIRHRSLWRHGSFSRLLHLLVRAAARLLAWQQYCSKCRRCAASPSKRVKNAKNVVVLLPNFKAMKHDQGSHLARSVRPTVIYTLCPSHYQTNILKWTSLN